LAKESLEDFSKVSLDQDQQNQIVIYLTGRPWLWNRGFSGRLTPDHLD